MRSEEISLAQRHVRSTRSTAECRAVKHQAGCISTISRSMGRYDRRRKFSRPNSEFLSLCAELLWNSIVTKIASPSALPSALMTYSIWNSHFLTKSIYTCRHELITLQPHEVDNPRILCSHRSPERSRHNVSVIIFSQHAPALLPKYVFLAPQPHVHRSTSYH